MGLTLTATASPASRRSGLVYIGAYEDRGGVRPDRLAFGVVWLAGERHRGNCIRAGEVACSVLPCEQGRVNRSAEARQSKTGSKPKLRPLGCMALEDANATALSEDQIETDPARVPGSAWRAVEALGGRSCRDS